MPEAKKTHSLIEKTILVLKTMKIHMKKRHSTVLQNARSQKNKHSHWKNNSGLKNPINSYEKTAQHRLTKCLKPKQQTLSLKTQFWSQKHYKFIWKNGTAPSYKMPEAKKTNTPIEKTILVLNTLKIHMKKRRSTVLQNAWG